MLDCNKKPLSQGLHLAPRVTVSELKEVKSDVAGIRGRERTPIGHLSTT